MCRRAGVAALLLIALLQHGPTLAQGEGLAKAGEARAQRWRDMALTKDAEVGFERFLHMAQTGQLGADVRNANITVFKNHARLELLRGDAPKQVFLLTPRSSTTAASRYFSIEPGEGASAADVEGVAPGLQR